MAESTAVAAQALQRIESFERRTGVRVSRIMAPPHSACSIIGARGVLRAGFSALCTTPAPRAPESDVALVEWHRADFVAGGLPNIARHTLNGSRDDLAFRALLGQPLVLYLHHDDLAAGWTCLQTRPATWRPAVPFAGCRSAISPKCSSRRPLRATPRTSGSSRAVHASQCRTARSGSSSSCPGTTSRRMRCSN